MAFTTLSRHIGHCPRRVFSTDKPRGCGGRSRGGGTDGPVGARDRERAGEDGENHHSRNLMKNMENGKRYLRESSKIRGDLKSRRFIRERMVC